jgi:predicted Zn-dependent protease
MTSAYVRTVGRQLAMRASGPRYPYTVSIANYAELNAFALPGGKVWITRGMIEAAVNEAQLAGVIAHEIAHIGNRDAAGAFNQRLVARGLSGMPGAPLRGDGPVPSIARVMAEGYRLQFSPDEEQEADAAAVGIMRRAGWDPSGIAEFIEIVRKADERDPVIVAAFLLTHPFSDTRVERLTTLVKNAPGGARDSDEFRRIHARVLRMPAARPMPRSGV